METTTVYVPEYPCIAGVYTITHKSTGRVYVGSALHIGKRWYLHRWQLNLGRHHSRFLQRTWDKYGAEDFEFSIIEIEPDEQLRIQREQFWIDHYRAYSADKGFNSRAIADSNIGTIVSTETRAKRGLAIKEAYRKKRERGYIHNPASRKLSVQRVLEIKELIAFGELTFAEISARFGIDKGSISSLARRITYQEIVAPPEIEEAIKHRHRCYRRPQHLPPCRIGSAHARAKLSDKQVLEIKHLLAIGQSSGEIATRYEVNYSTIRNIAAGKTYRDVKAPQSVEDAISGILGTNKGERHPNRIITALQAREVKRCLAKGEMPTAIARKLGISVKIAQNIRSGHSWSHIMVEPEA